MKSFTVVSYKLGSLLIVGTLALMAGETHAVVTSGSSKGYGIDVDVTLLPIIGNGIPIMINEMPVAEGSAPAPYTDSDTALAINILGLVATDVLNATATSNVNGTPGNKTAYASGDVDELSVLSILNNIAVFSETRVSGDYNSFTTFGRTIIDGLEINGNPVLDLEPAPNTDLFALLGLGAITGVSVILNEQMTFGEGGVLGAVCISECSRVTNAIHVIIDDFGLIGGLGLASGDIILGHSEARLTAAPNVIPIPSAIWLLGSGLLGILALRKKKRTH